MAAKKRTTRKETFTRWDAADYLRSDADIAAYLGAALAEGDTALLTAVLNDIAKARGGGVNKLAEDIGMSRQGLYKALGPHGNPSFDTMLKLTRALNLEMKFEPRAAA